MKYKIQRSLSPSSEDINFLTEKINQESKEFKGAFPFGFFVYDEDSNIIAGANGSVIYGKIYTDQLWVDPVFRKKGIAKGIMKEVHKFGLDQGCSMSTVATMDFQDAVKFYETLGYEVEFESKGYAKNSSCFFMHKKLKLNS
ncbi:MAG: GNAT family N-acetyltransferase [Alphaproteobacteria bacterium]|nr:GNAT family N-acetyltransferase [Alphaproteobacteria bacterium]